MLCTSGTNCIRITKRFFSDLRCTYHMKFDPALWLCSRLWNKIDHGMRGNTNTISFFKAHSNKMALNDLLVSSYLRRVGKYKKTQWCFSVDILLLFFLFLVILLFPLFSLNCAFVGILFILWFYHYIFLIKNNGT